MAHLPAQFHSLCMLILAASADTTVYPTIHENGQTEGEAAVSTRNKTEGVYNNQMNELILAFVKVMTFNKKNNCTII